MSVNKPTLYQRWQIDHDPDNPKLINAKPNAVFVRELTCPKCGLPELDETTGLLNIRGFKVHTDGRWWSHCLPCDHWF